MNWNSFKPYLDQSWWRVLQGFIESKACDEIYSFLKKRSGVATILPESKNTWRAFALCKYSNLKIVMIGQDPYPKKGVADGLAFSCHVPENEHGLLQPSLETMLNAIEEDCYGGLNLRMSVWPSLEEWALDGVLLLNYSLTTEMDNPGAHKDLWEPLHEHLIKHLNKDRQHLVYMLLGSKARDLRRYIDEENNLVLEAEHPSAANRGSRKWKHENIFSKANGYLLKMRNESVDWGRHLPF